MKQYTELRETFTRYIHGQLSAEETQGFLEYIQSGKSREVFEQFIQETIDDPVQADQIRESLLYPVLDRSWSDLQKRIGQEAAVKTINWRRTFSIAAAIVCVFSVCLWFYLKRPSPVVAPEITQESIMPGQQTATLTLADGTQIRLADSDEGELAKDGDVIISKGADGHLSYEITEGAESSGGFNTLSTARGETYRVKLPDGTQVWLNAASSIRYAANFSKHAIREVELDGEAYFEVVKDTKRPFKVKSNGQTIHVLGTSFNINSYADEPAILTTLLEGKVAVSLPSGEKKQLNPDQQSVVQIGSSHIAVRKVEALDAVDWKNGDFVFNNMSIGAIMRKISRWYDLDVVFRGEISSVNFGGVISRSKEITEVLQLLELTGDVHFTFEETDNNGKKGRRVVVMP